MNVAQAIADTTASLEAVARTEATMATFQQVIEESVRLAKADKGGSDYSRAMLDISKWALAQMQDISKSDKVLAASAGAVVAKRAPGTSRRHWWWRI